MARIEGPTIRERLALGALALGGQTVGAFCGALLGSLLGLASRIWPSLGSEQAVDVLLPILFFGVPLLGAWMAVKRANSRASSLAVALSACILSSLLFVGMARASGGDRRAVGAMLPVMLVALPVASVTGGAPGSYVTTRGGERR